MRSYNLSIIKNTTEDQWFVRASMRLEQLQYEQILEHLALMGLARYFEPVVYSEAQHPGQLAIEGCNEL